MTLAMKKRMYDNQVGKYLKSFPVIEKLVQEDLLYVDHKKPYVALSLRLHLAYMDNEVKLATRWCRFLLRIGLLERDVRYKTLLNNVLAYISYRRGLEGLSVFSQKDKLDFLVMNLENTKPLFVGVYQHGELGYTSLGDG